MNTNRLLIHGKNARVCHCSACAVIHADYIGRFGRWPAMTHAESQQVKAKRAGR